MATAHSAAWVLLALLPLAVNAQSVSAAPLDSEPAASTVPASPALKASDAPTSMPEAGAAPSQDAELPPPPVEASPREGAPVAEEVRQQDGGGRLWMGMLLGGAAGAGVGYIAGSAGLLGPCGDGDEGPDSWCPTAKALSAAGGAAVGILLGAVIGAGLDEQAEKAAEGNSKTASTIRLVPTVGVGTQGAFGGVLGRF